MTHRRIVLENSQIHKPGLEPRSAKELQAGKAAKKEKYKTVAEAETPAAIRSFYPVNNRGGNPWLKAFCFGWRPRGRLSLFRYLVECGRFVLNPTNQKQWEQWGVESKAAEKWARDKMRAHGLAVPRKIKKGG